MHKNETRVCKCCDNDKKIKSKVFLTNFIIIYKKKEDCYRRCKSICKLKGIASSIPKDPIDSAIVKLHTIHKTFLLKIPSDNKLRFATHPKYIVII